MKTWYLSYNNKDEFEINIGTKSLILTFLSDIIDFINHNVLKYVPMVPFPIIHWGNWICENKRIHFHMSYNWYGWSIGDILCMTLEGYLFNKSLDNERQILSFSVSEEDLAKFYGRDADFIQECKENDRNYVPNKFGSAKENNK